MNGREGESREALHGKAAWKAVVEL